MIDERDHFESIFPMPPHCVRCGDGYAATEHNAWSAHDYIQMWKGWSARSNYEPAFMPEAWQSLDGEQGYDYIDYFDNETYGEDFAKRNPNHKGWVKLLCSVGRGKIGAVHVTRDETGKIVAVTRQDHHGRILSIIAE